MEFELTQVLEMIEGLLKSNVNHAKYDELVKMKEEVTKILEKEKVKIKCDFCTKPCGKEWCPTKENK